MHHDHARGHSSHRKGHAHPHADVPNLHVRTVGGSVVVLVALAPLNGWRSPGVRVILGMVFLRDGRPLESQPRESDKSNDLTTGCHKPLFVPALYLGLNSYS